uniref:Uncharacterized protein n=1 Tax=Rhizophora mucronata TaxID=61149 RepID=A0A2P2R223_RHIMU
MTLQWATISSNAQQNKGKFTHWAHTKVRRLIMTFSHLQSRLVICR